MKEDKPFYEALGRRVVHWRTERRMSQERLGNLLVPSMTRAAISNIETAKQRVLAHVLVDIARVLSVGVTDLIDTPRVPSASNETEELRDRLAAAELGPNAVKNLEQSIKRFERQNRPEIKGPQR